MKKKRKKLVVHKISLLYSFLAILPFALLLTMFMYAVQKQRGIDSAYQLLETKSVQLRYAIESRLLSSDILEAMIINRGGEPEDFNKLAARLYNEDSALRSIQLAPMGVVEYAYPKTSNEKGMIDLFEDPERAAEAKWARDTGRTTLSGPYELLQGGMGVVARNPIYLKDSSGEDYFWGFAIIVLNVPEVFDSADLNELTKDNYYFKITRNDPEKGEVEVFSNTDIKFDDTVKNNVEIPNGTWQFSICPMDGWVNLRSFFGSIILIFLFIVLATTGLFIVWSLLLDRVELVKLANTDALTEIYNDRFFKEKIAELSSEKLPFALFYLDLNNFKEINDKFGHEEGNGVLIEVAYRIKRCITDNDFAVRLGRDDYAVIIPEDKTEEFCNELEQQLREAISQPYELFDKTIFPNTSIGFARYPADSENLDKIMWLADMKLSIEKKKAK